MPATRSGPSQPTTSPVRQWVQWPHGPYSAITTWSPTFTKGRHPVDTRPDRFHHAGGLVAEHHREGGHRGPAVKHVQVRAAHPRRRHLYEHLAGLRLVELDGLEVGPGRRVVHHDCLHGRRKSTLDSNDCLNQYCRHGELPLGSERFGGNDEAWIPGVRRGRPRDLPGRPLVAVSRRQVRRPDRAQGASGLRPLQPGHRRRPLVAAHHEHLRQLPEGDQLDDRRHGRPVRRHGARRLHRRPRRQRARDRRRRRHGDLRARVRHVARRHRPRAASRDGARVQPLGRGDARGVGRQGHHVGPDSAQRRRPRGHRDPVRVRRARHPLLLDPPEPVQPPQPRRPLLRPGLRAAAGSRLRVRDPRVHGSERADRRAPTGSPRSPSGTPSCTATRRSTRACR